MAFEVRHLHANGTTPECQEHLFTRISIAPRGSYLFNPNPMHCRKNAEISRQSSVKRPPQPHPIRRIDLRLPVRTFSRAVNPFLTYAALYIEPQHR